MGLSKCSALSGAACLDTFALTMSKSWYSRFFMGLLNLSWGDFLYFPSTKARGCPAFLSERLCPLLTASPSVLPKHVRRGSWDDFCPYDSRKHPPWCLAVRSRFLINVLHASYYGLLGYPFYQMSTSGECDKWRWRVILLLGCCLFFLAASFLAAVPGFEWLDFLLTSPFIDFCTRSHSLCTLASARRACFMLLTAASATTRPSCSSSCAKTS